ncbi:hypothetical protein N7539_007791 [Penicillium diatomitis]|uniref:F-box domain-containing protein n=1 Tax=Penicillium diatomitis TaxID=2819901 RepID=A0A9W9WU38_9EURO|nr:uncharacterized protein N7539_007791 [Penicillium diatomitis]KAJ5475504.1 hypothetical protein N7539_007791 [Penicillium diatomitis]
MAQCLDSCPTEILQSIFDLLSSSEYRALCLVNRNLRTHAEPFLYSQIEWIWREVDGPPPVVKLLRSIIRRPDLASFIKYLCLDGKCFSDGVYRKSIPPLVTPQAKIEIDDLNAFVRNTQLPQADVWIKELQKGTIDAFVALLVAQASNIRHLSLGPAFTQRTEILGVLLRSALCPPSHMKLPTFELLEIVSIRLQTWEDRARGKSIKNTANILPLFYLPNAKSMSVSIESPSVFSWPASYPPSPTNLVNLDLTCVREVSLGNVLAAMVHLRRLSWKWYYDFGLDDDTNKPIVELDQIGAALAHVKDTLEDLSIVADIGVGGNDQFLPAIKTRGCLHEVADLTKLRKIQIPWAFLVGFVQDTNQQLLEVIPRNIEEVIITNDLRLQNDDEMEPSWPAWEWTDHAIITLLENWLRDWKEHTPFLRSVSLHWTDHEFQEWDPQMRRRLKEVGAQVGIFLEIVMIESFY